MLLLVPKLKMFWSVLFGWKLKMLLDWVGWLELKENDGAALVCDWLAPNDVVCAVSLVSNLAVLLFEG